MSSINPSELEFLQKLRTHLRTKPGMYFGFGGIAVIPLMVSYAIEDLLLLSESYRGDIDVIVSAHNEVSIEFKGLKSDAFSPSSPQSWFRNMFQGNRRRGLTLALVAAGSEKFTFESSDGLGCAKLVLIDNQEPVFEFRESSESFVRITFISALSSSRDQLTHNHLYNLAGRLKDISLLHAGTRTRLSADNLAGKICYYYERGLASVLIEDDHTRWSLLNDGISFSGSKDDMRVEGHMRFVHAGPAHVRSYVNFFPAHGGAHYEGLGRALKELFPDSTRGCREVTFITNSNSGACVHLPHSFTAAIHLQMNDPRFEGPTQDILIGDAVRDFIYEVAAPQIRQQWEEKRTQR